MIDREDIEGGLQIALAACVLFLVVGVIVYYLGVLATVAVSAIVAFVVGLSQLLGT